MIKLNNRNELKVAVEDVLNNYITDNVEIGTTKNLNQTYEELGKELGLYLALCVDDVINERRFDLLGY